MNNILLYSKKSFWLVMLIRRL